MFSPASGSATIPDEVDPRLAFRPSGLRESSDSLHGDVSPNGIDDIRASPPYHRTRPAPAFLAQFLTSKCSFLGQAGPPAAGKSSLRWRPPP